MSEHYRGAYAGSKAQAGFTCYRGGDGRGGRTLLDPSQLLTAKHTRETVIVTARFRSC